LSEAPVNPGVKSPVRGFFEAEIFCTADINSQFHPQFRIQTLWMGEKHSQSTSMPVVGNASKSPPWFQGLLRKVYINVASDRQQHINISSDAFRAKFAPEPVRRRLP